MSSKKPKLPGIDVQNIIVNIYKKLLSEETSEEKPVAYDKDIYIKVFSRVATLTGLPSMMVLRIVNNHRFTLSVREIPKKIKLNESHYHLIRRLICHIVTNLNNHPTLEFLQQQLEENIGHQICLDSLNYALRRLSFKTTTCKDCTYLIEKDGIRLRRILFLQKMEMVRKGSHPIVYIGDSSILNRYIIMLAGNVEGSIGNSLFIEELDKLKNKQFALYEYWLTTHLLPNLSPQSIILYFNKLDLQKAPRYSLHSKRQMIKWLQDRNIKYSNNMLKPYLYKLIKHYKYEYYPSHIDDILNRKGHTVIRIPPYHSEFNAIHNIWTQISQYIKSNYTPSSNMLDIKELVNRIVLEMDKEEWTKVCKQVEKCEDEYRTWEPQLDNRLEEERFLPCIEDPYDDFDTPRSSDSFVSAPTSSSISSEDEVFN